MRVRPKATGAAGRRMTEDAAWTPHKFELAFGLAGREARDKRDSASADDPVALDIGLILRTVPAVFRGHGAY